MRSYDGCKVHCTAKAEHAFDGFSDLIVRRRRAGRDSDRPGAFRKPAMANDFFVGSGRFMPDCVGVENRCGILEYGKSA